MNATTRSELVRFVKGVAKLSHNVEHVVGIDEAHEMFISCNCLIQALEKDPTISPDEPRVTTDAPHG